MTDMKVEAGDTAGHTLCLPEVPPPSHTQQASVVPHCALSKSTEPGPGGFCSQTSCTNPACLCHSRGSGTTSTETATLRGPQEPPPHVCQHPLKGPTGSSGPVWHADLPGLQQYAPATMQSQAPAYLLQMWSVSRIGRGRYCHLGTRVTTHQAPWTPGPAGIRATVPSAGTLTLGAHTCPPFRLHLSSEVT
jgi:hypothetical protein